ncbi:MAG: hypothetical protein ABI639_10915 [Thermoanaerobaculia bacterium]
MNRQLPVLALVVSALLNALPLAAQEEPTFVSQMNVARRNLAAIDSALAKQERELSRYLEVLFKLQDGARQLAKAAPMTGRDAALDSVEEARAIAETDPEMGPLVFETLDRCRIEVEKNVIGESGPAAAARYLREILKLEEEANGRFSFFVNQVDQYQTLIRGIESGANQHLLVASQALARLYVLHSFALSTRDEH